MQHMHSRASLGLHRHRTFPGVLQQHRCRRASLLLHQKHAHLACAGLGLMEQEGGRQRGGWDGRDGVG